jgi:small conductance mechanosensitive channel
MTKALRLARVSLLALALAFALALVPAVPIPMALGPALQLPVAGATAAEPQLPPPQATAPRPQTADDLRDSGSFRRGKVRILGIPVLTVASPAVSDSAGPNARLRAQVIEGNLELLYRPQEVCSQAEDLGEAILDLLYLKSGKRSCDSNQLGLLGSPAALKVEVVIDSSGIPVLQARVPGREQPLPLLSVTDEDARLNGTTSLELADRWRALLERRLRFARHLLEPGVLGLRFRVLAFVELALVGLLLVNLLLWRTCQQRLAQLLTETPPNPVLPSRWVAWRRSLQFTTLLLLTRGLLGAMVLLLPLMIGVIVLAVPGQIPLAINLLFQPFQVVGKLALGWLLSLLLRAVVRTLLSQWRGNRSLTQERRARRDQRFRSLLRVSQRLADLACILLVSLWVVVGIPGVHDLSNNALLASGALLGALALVFQDLLRDFVAGLLLLLEDRFAIGDAVTIDGHSGDVVDVGLLSTELRSTDQRVVVIPNSHCKQVVNATKLRSGRELHLSLSHRAVDLRQALAVLDQALKAFASDPLWSGDLLETPRLLGLQHVTPEGLEVALLVVTRAGRQGPVERELLLRLVEALQAGGIPLAESQPLGIGATA